MSVKCNKCKSSLKLDTYSVCRVCHSVEIKKDMNPMSFLDENMVNIMLELLIKEDKANSNRKLEKDYMQLFNLVLKARLNNISNGL